MAHNGFNKVLILAPHIDDGELGCGASVARFIEEGKDVYYCAFSPAEQSVPDGLPVDILKKELGNSSAVVGIKKENIIVYNYPVRVFYHHRQEILENMITLLNDINPDIVFTPSQYDTHQDHKTISEESLRAFKKKTLLGYEAPYNNLTFETTCFIKIDGSHLDKKIRSIECYQSQEHRMVMSERFVRALAITRGTQINHMYAEAFSIMRWII